MRIEIEEVYRNALGQILNQIEAGQQVFLRNALIGAEGGFYPSHPVAETVRAARTKFFLTEAFRKLQSLPYATVKKLITFEDEDVFAAVGALCPSEEKLQRMTPEAFAEAVTGSILLPERTASILSLPLVVALLLERNPQLIEKLDEHNVSSLHTLFPRPKKPRAEEKFREADLATAAAVLDTVPEELAAKLFAIDRFIERSTRPGSERNRWLGDYALVHNQYLGWTNAARGPGGVEEIRQLFDSVDLKREVMLTLQSVLMKRVHICYAAGFSGIGDLIDKRSAFRLNSVQFTTTRQAMDDYALNQIHSAWSSAGAGDYIPPVRLASMLKMSTRYNAESQEVIVTVRDSAAKHRLARDMKYRNTTKFYPACVWILNHYVKAAKELIETKSETT